MGLSDVCVGRLQWKLVAVHVAVVTSNRVQGQTMTKPINTAKFKDATGRDFSEWLAYLSKIKAEALSHKEIAAHLTERAGVDGWWAQSITVAYEQHSGRRHPGQRKDGTFSANVSRTLDGPPDRWFRAWCKLMAGEQFIAGQKLSAAPTTTDPKSGPNWRCKFADGSRVVMGMTEISPGKCRAALEHLGLTKDAVSAAKSYWRSKLDDLK